MKGQQILQLTEDSLKEAVQEYLCRHMVSPVAVSRIAVTGGKYDTMGIEVFFEQLDPSDGEGAK